jgi:uncharacterized protein (DUF885 family)
MNTQLTSAEAGLECALRIVDDAWGELQRSLYVQQQLGIAQARLPDLSFAEASRRSEVGASLLRRMDSLDTTALPHDLLLSLRLVRFRAQAWAREADWYWLVTDPLGIGFYGLFLPGAYCGGWFLNTVHGVLASCGFADPGDGDRYLALIADYARVIDQFAERTAGQAQRGIRIPKQQVPQARALLSGFKAQARSVLSVTPERLGAHQTAAFMRELQRRIELCVEPAFDRALTGLSDAYLHDAPDAVGINQYPGGPDIYPELVKAYTTLSLSPDQIHARGLQRIAQIESAMAAIRAELGFQGNGAEFLEHLARDPRWRADTSEGVAAFFQRYIDRLARRFDEYFCARPAATCGVAPLPEPLQASMTYGYYDAPRPGRSRGVYLFNSANLTKQSLVHVGALTYHELMPGHHLHFATQQENPRFHPFRKYSFVNACNEGWAEYAATFVGEIGLYEEPQERYGRLIMDAFLTSRLVVDTGMNALGWSLERARDYMRLHSGMTESDIRSETLRYSCDIPGQALAYKLGDTQIRDLRERIRASLGDRFDLKAFHAAVVDAGTLPLPDLEWHVEHAMRQAGTVTQGRAP